MSFGAGQAQAMMQANPLLLRAYEDAARTVQSNRENAAQRSFQGGQAEADRSLRGRIADADRAAAMGDSNADRIQQAGQFASQIEQQNVDRALRQNAIQIEAMPTARDAFVAEANRQQQEQRFQNQLYLQDQELTQGEKMRLQQLQQAKVAIQGEVTAGRLDESEAADMMLQLQTGIDPLKRRQAQAEVQRQKAETDRFMQQTSMMKASEMQNARFDASSFEERTRTIVDGNVRAMIEAEYGQELDAVVAPIAAMAGPQAAQAEREKRLRQMAAQVGGLRTWVQQKPGDWTRDDPKGGSGGTGGGTSGKTAGGYKPGEPSPDDYRASYEKHYARIKREATDPDFGGYKEGWTDERVEAEAEKATDAAFKYAEKKSPPKEQSQRLTVPGLGEKPKPAAQPAPERPRPPEKPLDLGDRGKLDISQRAIAERFDADEAAIKAAPHGPLDGNREAALKAVGELRKLYAKTHGRTDIMTPEELARGEELARIVAMFRNAAQFTPQARPAQSMLAPTGRQYPLEN